MTTDPAAQSHATKNYWLDNPKTQVRAAVLSAFVAMFSFLFSLYHYYNVEDRRVKLDQRESRIRFLELLGTISDVARESVKDCEVHKDAEGLGTLQSLASRECLVALLQAEQLLPELESQKVVTPHEYVILAEESLFQGYREAASKYAKTALVGSLDPHVMADAKVVMARLSYSRGEVDAGHKQFEECISIYDRSTELTSDAQLEGKVQVYVTWCETELGAGDKSFSNTREIIDRAESSLKRMRNGSLKKSGIRYFEDRRKEIGYTQSQSSPIKDM